MDDFIGAVETCFYKYANVKGRAQRPEFWWFALFLLFYLVVSAVAISVVGALVGTAAGAMGGNLLRPLKVIVWIAIFAMVVPVVTVGARRLHDIGKTGWLQLLWLVPVVGWGILLYWLAQPSAPANQYGGLLVDPDSPTVMPGFE